VVAPVQGDEGGNPGEVENPGEHRAPDGINPRLGATNSRGEKGPEDEPISLSTACLRFTWCGGLRSDVPESGEHPVCKRGASFGWWHAGKTCDGCGVRIRSVTTACRRPPDRVFDRGASHGHALDDEAGRRDRLRRNQRATFFSRRRVPGTTTAGVVNQWPGVQVAGGASARPARSATLRCRGPARTSTGPLPQLASRKRGTEGELRLAGSDGRPAGSRD
jgi:hypothetical protein